MLIKTELSLHPPRLIPPIFSLPASSHCQQKKGPQSKGARKPLSVHRTFWERRLLAGPSLVKVEAMWGGTGEPGKGSCMLNSTRMQAKLSGTCGTGKEAGHMLRKMELRLYLVEFQFLGMSPTGGKSEEQRCQGGKA